MKDTTEYPIRELMQFLTKSEGKEIWLLVDNGVIISGTLQSLSSDAPETITLAKATLFQGNKPLFVKEAQIIIRQIAASGIGNPHLPSVDAHR